MANGDAHPSARDVLGQALERGHEELGRTSAALAFSGFAAGLGMGLSGLGIALVLAALGESPRHELIGQLLYPLGFIVVIIGRQQLFTENTLYPVAVVLDERRREQIVHLLRLWVVVFVANVLGSLVFATWIERADSTPTEVTHALAKLGVKAVDHTSWHVFASAVVGGWLIALTAWLVLAGRDTMGHVALIWLVTFIVGDGHFAHSIATSGEILAAVVHGSVGVGSYLDWLWAATLGNIVGGVLVVALLNYGQVVAGGGETGGD
jgi:formate/nitrite transporter FocA (FNT family)